MWITIKNFKSLYKSIFSIEEINNSRPLQWVFFGFMGYFFYVLMRWGYTNNWIARSAVESNNHLCWPYFLNCGDYYFLEPIQQGYSQTILYTFFLILFTFSIVSAVRRKWAWAHLLMMPLFIWKFLYVFLFTYKAYLVFPIFHLSLVAIWLFARNKLFFLRVGLVTLYFWAVIVKLHDSWIVGTYFSTLEYGLPLLPNWTIPFATNFIILLEIFGCWGLLLNNRKHRYIFLGIWLAFHFYSSILIGYRYPLICIPLLLSLYTCDFHINIPRFKWRISRGWVLIFLIFLTNSTQWMIRGDQKYTLEGIKFALVMFDANHQCQINQKFVYKNGEVKESQLRVKGANSRCDPYSTWFYNQRICSRYSDKIERIEWSHYSSINGGPFYKVVDVKDSCQLKYSMFFHNEWIKTPEFGASIVGYPSKNSLSYYYAGEGTKFIYEQPQIALEGTQYFFRKYKKVIIAFWFSLWVVVLMGLFILIYLETKSKKEIIDKS